MESAVRSVNMPIPEGEVIELRGLRVEVLEVGDHGPTRVELSFDRDLEDPSLNFMAVINGELRNIDVPSVGETLTLQSPW
jgi:hypothetical protein